MKIMLQITVTVDEEGQIDTVTKADDLVNKHVRATVALGALEVAKKSILESNFKAEVKQ